MMDHIKKVAVQHMISTCADHGGGKGIDGDARLGVFLAGCLGQTNDGRLARGVGAHALRLVKWRGDVDQRKEGAGLNKAPVMPDPKRRELSRLTALPSLPAMEAIRSTRPWSFFCMWGMLCLVTLKLPLTLMAMTLSKSSPETSATLTPLGPEGRGGGGDGKGA
jgi:hypothetical protein